MCLPCRDPTLIFMAQIQDPFKKQQADLQARDLSGKFSKLDPPLVSFSLTNPMTYIRKWWKAVMDGEGVDIRLKIHPLTAIAIILAVGGVSFGIGRVSILSQVAKYIPILATPVPTIEPTPNPWREAAFAGLLQQQGDRFYLIGDLSQAFLLEVPDNVNLSKYVGRKILASGSFNSTNQILRVSIASDLELITGNQPIPTLVPTPTPTTLPTPTILPESSPSPSPSSNY